MFWYGVIGVIIGIIIGCFGTLIIFKKSGDDELETVGTFVVDVSDNDTDIYRVEFDTPPYAIEELKYAKLKVEVIR